MPYWKTDNKEYVLKVNNTFINHNQDLMHGERYNIKVDFESYCVEALESDKTIKRYYSNPRL
jgi:hypothetical protein